MVGAPMGSAFRNVDNKLLHCGQSGSTAEVPMGSGFRNVDNKIINCLPGNVERIGMGDQ